MSRRPTRTKNSPEDVWLYAWMQAHGHARGAPCAPSCPTADVERDNPPHVVEGLGGEALGIPVAGKGALRSGEAIGEGKGDPRGETTLDPLAAHRLLKHLSRMLTWAYREALTAHTAIPRVAAGQIAYRLAEKHLEEMGDDLCQWVGEVSRGH